MSLIWHLKSTQIEGTLKGFAFDKASNQFKNFCMKKQQVRILVLVVALFGFVPRVHAEVLFEAYYRLELDGAHVGYVIQQHKLDDKTKNHEMRYFVATKTPNGLDRISVESVSTPSFKPLRFRAWGRSGTMSVIASTQGQVSGEQMLIRYMTGDGQKVAREEKLAIPAGAVMSAFLFHSLGKMPKESKNYNAFSEEGLRFRDGTALLRQTFAFNKTKVRQVENSFINQTMDFFLFPNNEMMASYSAEGHRLSYIVPDQKTAVGALEFKKTEVTDLFGGQIPAGKANPLKKNDFLSVRKWLKEKTSKTVKASIKKK